MAASSGKGEDDIIADINVTPLVDVVLVLLIIFMITAPALYQSAIEVDLPKAQSGEQAQKTTLTFTITADGELSLDKEKLTWDKLPRRLAQIPALASTFAVINADEKAQHGLVIRLMDALRVAGLKRIAFMVKGEGGL